MRSLLRPVAFVDSPFGHDGKVARLAGGLNWFAAIELIGMENGRRVSTELVAVEEIEASLDDELARQWKALTSPRAALQLGDRVIRLDQPHVMGIVNATPDSFSDGGQFADASEDLGEQVEIEARLAALKSGNTTKPAIGASAAGAGAESTVDEADFDKL